MKIIVDNKEINYFLIDEGGRVLETGEEEGLNTFRSTVIDLESLEIGGYLKLCFNINKSGKYFDVSHNSLKVSSKEVKAIWVDLNYKTLRCE